MRALVLLFALVACQTDKPDDTVDDTPDDTLVDTTEDTTDTNDTDDTDVEDTDAEDTDTEDTDDTDVDDGFPTATSPCLFFHGMMSSTTSWDYRWLASNRIGGRTMSTFEFDAANHTATLRTDESWTQTTGGVSFTGTTYDYFVCNDDGLHITRRLVNSTLTLMGNAEVESVETIYDTPALVRPNDIALGDSWTQVAVGTVIRGDGTPDQSINSTTTYTVTEEMVSFPNVQIAGTPAQGIMGLKVEGGGTSYYWSRGFGVVNNPNISELTVFDPGMPQQP